MKMKSAILCSMIASLGFMHAAIAADEAPAAKPAAAQESPAPVKEMTGQEIAFDKNKGNCLSCHVINDPKATSPGNLGPSLEGVKDRYTKEALRAQIWDATKNNPYTAMPPMGRNKIMTEQEIDKVVDYLLSL